MMGHKANGNVVMTKRLLENGGKGGFGLDVQSYKFKRRSVSAKRDFPKGCGRFAVRVGENLNGNGGVEKLEEEEEDVPATSLENLEPMSVDTLTVWVKPIKASNSGKEDVSKNLHRTKLSDHLSDTDEPASKDLRRNASMSEEKELTSSLAVKFPVDSVIPDRSVKLEISDDTKTSVSADVLVRWAREKFLPRRRISACRDFPPGCGRIVTHANSESRQTSAGSFNNGSKLKQGDTERTNAKTSPGNDMSQSDLRYSRVGVSGGKLGKESVKLKNNMNCKRKFPEKFSSESPGIRQSQGKGFESEDRVIVYSLMAEQNCPWRQGKKTFNKPASRNQFQVEERQGKKTSNPSSGNQSQVVERQGKKTSNPSSGNQSQVVERQGKKTSNPLSGNQSQVVERQGKNISQPVIRNQHKMEEHVGSELSEDRGMVLALMAAPNCPWRHGKHRKRPFKAPAGHPKQSSKYLWSVTVQEMTAIMQGLRTAADMRFRRRQVRSDSLGSVKDRQGYVTEAQIGLFFKQSPSFVSEVLHASAHHFANGSLTCNILLKIFKINNGSGC